MEKTLSSEMIKNDNTKSQVKSVSLDEGMEENNDQDNDEAINDSDQINDDECDNTSYYDVEEDFSMVRQIELKLGIIDYIFFSY